MQCVRVLQRVCVCANTHHLFLESCPKQSSAGKTLPWQRGHVRSLWCALFRIKSGQWRLEEASRRCWSKVGPLYDLLVFNRVWFIRSAANYDEATMAQVEQIQKEVPIPSSQPLYTVCVCRVSCRLPCQLHWWGKERTCRVWRVSMPRMMQSIRPKSRQV